jgi:Ion channel
LICSYLLSAFITSRWVTDTQIALFTVAGLVAIRGIRLRRDEFRKLASAGFVISVLVIIVANHEGGTIGRGVASLWAGLLLLVIVAIILREILSAPAVTVQSIYGALSAYLIIGLMFSAFYAAMYYFNGRSFFAAGQQGSSSNFQYFSFTTLTTLGYGDFTAKYNPGRAIAMLEAMTGQIFLATLVAKLVASFRPARLRGTQPGAGGSETERPG